MTKPITIHMRLNKIFESPEKIIFLRQAIMGAFFEQLNKDDNPYKSLKEFVENSKKVYGNRRKYATMATLLGIADMEEYSKVNELDYKFEDIHRLVVKGLQNEPFYKKSFKV